MRLSLPCISRFCSVLSTASVSTQISRLPFHPSELRTRAFLSSKKTIVLIQARVRGFLARSRIHRQKLLRLKESEETREKQLRELGGYNLITRTWHTFLPLTPAQATLAIRRSIVNTVTEPPWAPRYNISEPLPALSDALRSQCGRQGGTSDLTLRRRRLMTNPLMPLSIASGPPSRGEDREGKPGMRGSGVDPAARQLQRNVQLRKELLRLRRVELIKECRTRTLETTGSKFHLVARFEEYLDNTIKIQHARRPPSIDADDP